MERNCYHYPTEKRSGAFDSGSGFGSSKRVKAHHTQLLSPLVVPVGHASFRLLCPLSQVGAVIGKSGTVIKQLQQSAGAKIRVEEPPFGSPDRIITIIAQVDSKSRVTAPEISGEFPNVREAIFHITSRLRDNFLSNRMKNSVTKSHATLTTERIYDGQSDNPLSIGSHQSFSRPPTISSSLHRRSDDFFLNGSHSSVNNSGPYGTGPYTRPEDRFADSFNPSAGVSPNFGRRATMDHSDISHHLTEAPSRLWASPPPAAPRGLSDASGGLSSSRAGHVFGSGHKSAIVTNTTVEIKVPENAMSFVYGEHGYNLEQLRLISGARVIVHEPPLGTSDKIIVIPGTPDQTQAAQNLLHAFILTGETSLSKKYNLN